MAAKGTKSTGAKPLGIKAGLDYQAIFISKSREAHGEKYDYSKVVYVNAKTKVEIVCPEHGSFMQEPDSHRKGIGCRACGLEKCRPAKGIFTTKISQEQFLEKAFAVHGDTYDYSNSVFRGYKNKVTITCKKHGDFEITPAIHLTLKGGCKHCGIEKSHEHHYIRNSQDEFLALAKKTWGDTYDYSLAKYTTNKEPVEIICKEHGNFTIAKAANHYVDRQGCPECFNKRSKSEVAVSEYIKELGFEIVCSDRSTLDGQFEIDILVPSLNIGFEYNGNYWHSEKAGKSPRYHINKTINAARKGVRLVHIFEHEWETKKEIVKSKIKNILGVSQDRVFARKTSVVKLTDAEATSFYNLNHVQGNNRGNRVNYGLMSEDKIVACMSFALGGRLSTNTDVLDGEYELTRFASSIRVIGGFSKILKAFINEFNPESIESFSDRRWSVGHVYESNGFTLSNRSDVPNYFYSDLQGLKTLSRHQCQKGRLQKLFPEHYSDDLSEPEIMRKAGYVRIYDCGSDKWVLKVR